MEEETEVQAADSKAEVIGNLKQSASRSNQARQVAVNFMPSRQLPYSEYILYL